MLNMLRYLDAKICKVDVVEYAAKIPADKITAYCLNDS